VWKTTDSSRRPSQATLERNNGPELFESVANRVRPPVRGDGIQPGCSYPVKPVTCGLRRLWAMLGAAKSEDAKR
jgi:hypothetical protein